MYEPWDLEMKKYEENKKNYDGITLLIYIYLMVVYFLRWCRQQSARPINDMSGRLGKNMGRGT